VAVRYVNTALVATYWLIGKRIVEFEQKGKERAEYGERLLKKLSADLTKRFGKGFSFPQLKNIRQFYVIYREKSYTLSSQLNHATNMQTLSAELLEKSQTLSSLSEISHTLCAQFPLSWSHYCLLMRLDEPLKREFYEAECIKGNWSVRQLDSKFSPCFMKEQPYPRENWQLLPKPMKTYNSQTRGRNQRPLRSGVPWVEG